MDRRGGGDRRRDWLLDRRQSCGVDRRSRREPPSQAQDAVAGAGRGNRRHLSRRGARRDRIRAARSRRVAAGVIFVLFATQWDRWVGLSVRQVTDDADVRGDITPLGAKVEGYVRRVAVDDFQRVKEGDLLIEIEDDDYRARVAQAEADLLGAEAAIENLKARKAAQHAQVAEADDAIKATQADVERTRLEAARQRTLLATTFGTPQRVEQADAAAQRFAATLARNQAQLEAQHRQLAVLDTQEA